MAYGFIEGCVDSHASALAACRGGADRLELCANLAIGGTTPSAAVFKQVKRDCDVKINVLIRPRFGDFLYTEPEMEEMCTEIQAFRALGANGVRYVDARRPVRRVAVGGGACGDMLPQALALSGPLCCKT